MCLYCAYSFLMGHDQKSSQITALKLRALKATSEVTVPAVTMASPGLISNY